MPIISLDDWKQFISEHPAAHVLQTAEWGELKSAFGWDAVRMLCDGSGVQVLFRRLPLGFSVAYIPKPVMDILRDGSSRFWQELVGLCWSRGAVFLKIEPDAWETTEATQEAAPRAFAEAHRAAESTPEARLHPDIRRSGFNIQPPRTIIVDLRGSQDQMLARMKQKTRYNIRLAEKKDVTVRSWSDIAGFHELIKQTGGRDGFAVHSLEYYRRAYELFHPQGDCELLVAEHESRPLAALMVFRHGPRAWYLYGASNDLERNRMPTYLLQWQAMLWAKEGGALEYDLWGVPDEEGPKLEAGFETRQDGLWGVYRFKRGFGGTLHRAAQAWDVVFNPLLYRLYLWRMAGREGA